MNTSATPGMEKGGVTYVGAWSDKWEMEYDILRRVYGKVLGKLLCRRSTAWCCCFK